MIINGEYVNGNPNCRHNIKYEFDEERFNGWRGDRWCTKCDYALFSSESKRMENFGNIRILNPPKKGEIETGATDSQMFKIGELKI